MVDELESVSKRQQDIGRRRESIAGSYVRESRRAGQKIPAVHSEPLQTIIRRWSRGSPHVGGAAAILRYSDFKDRKVSSNAVSPQ